MTGVCGYRLFAFILSVSFLAYAPAGQSCVEGCLFEKEENLRVEPSVSVLAVGDVNNDKLPDIVTVGELGDEGIHIYIQGADRRFKPAESYYFSEGEPTEPVGNSVDLGDFNGDGYTDLAVTTHSGIRVLLRDGLGQFGASLDYPTESNYKLRAGDFNADGRDDLAGIGWGNGQLSVLLQNEAGSLDAPVHYAANYAGWNDLAVGDLNGDGLTDVVVMSGQLYSSDDFSVFFQNATGGFDAPAILHLASGNNPGGIGIGDVDGDGLNDLVALDPQASQLSIWTQTAAGGLNPPFTIGSGNRTRLAGAIEIADMNQDGLADIVFLVPYGSLAVHLQRAGGGFDAPILSGGHASSQIDPHGLAVADLDGDGKTDAVVARGYWMGGVDVHYATRADLELTLAADKTSAVVNDRIRYTATIANRGPDVSKDIRLEHVKPAGMFTAAGIFGSRGICDVSRGTCSLGALDPGTTATVTFETYSYNDTGTFTNTVNLSAFDYSALTKTASVNVEVAPSADLEIVSQGVNRPSYTTNLFYFAYVHNEGVIDAEGVVISDLLPAGVTPVTASWAMPWGTPTSPCAISAARVDCEIGRLPVDSTAVVSIQVQVNTTGNLLNTFTVAAATPDPDAANNRATRLSTHEGATIDQPPVIDAGGPYVVRLGSQTLLDARASFDPEGTRLSFLWDFPDGNQGWYRYVHHTFDTVGQAPVTVTATDADGGVASETFFVEVVNSPPRAYAGPPYYLQRKKSEILFDAQGSHDVDGGPLSYAWDFGDGSAAGGIQALHAYQRSGNYTATVTVADGAAATVATAKVVVFNTIPFCYAGGSFTYRRNQTVAFDGSGCVDGNGDALTHAWDFGDGGSSTEVDPTHVYASSGVYTVTLTVNDGEDDSLPAISTYTITNDAPVADGGGPYDAVKGRPLIVDGSASSDADNDTLTYRWDFGDGSFGTGVAPSHVYAKGGRYKLSLTVNDGEVDSAVYRTTVSVKNR